MKRRNVNCCLSIILAPFLVCGLYFGAETLYLALTKLPYDNETVDVYTLIPAKTTGVAVLTNYDLLEDPQLDKIFPKFYPHNYVRPLLALVQMPLDVVSEVTLISVERNSTAILIRTPQARSVFENLSIPEVERSQYGDNRIYLMTSPYAEGYGNAADNYNLETWAWALISDDLLIIGGVSTVENVIDIYHNHRPNLVEDRPIMRNVITLLRDKPNAYYNIRSEEDVATSRIIVAIARFFTGPLYGLLEMGSTEALAYAAEDVEDECISMMAAQMPSRKSAAIMSSPFNFLKGLNT